MKLPTLKTKRLLLTPMTEDEVAVLIEKTEDEDLKGAYGEMLDGARRHPESFLFYTPWAICEKDGTRVGDACFKGPQNCGAVEIGYGTEEAYRNRGYMTEACRRLIRWAFSQKDVYRVEAEVEPHNAASLRVVEKLGMTPTGTMGEEGLRLAVEKRRAKHKLTKKEHYADD